MRVPSARSIRTLTRFPASAIVSTPPSTGAEPNQARRRHGLAEVVVEDRDRRRCRRPVVHLAHGGVGDPVGAGDASIGLGSRPDLACPIGSRRSKSSGSMAAN